MVLSIGLSVGPSVCHNFLKGWKLLFNAPIGAFAEKDLSGANEHSVLLSELVKQNGSIIVIQSQSGNWTKSYVE